MPKARSLKQDGTPRKVRSDKGTTRGPRKPKSNVTILPFNGPAYDPNSRKKAPLVGYVKPGRAIKGYGAFMRAGGIFGASAVRTTPKRKYVRKTPKTPAVVVVSAPKATRAKTTRAKTTRKPSAYNQYVKDNYRLVKARNPGAKSQNIMKLVAAQWKSYTGSGYFF